MKKLIAASLLLAVSTSALAVVDMRNGNYSERFTDINLTGGSFDLKVTRIYNSRTSFDGMFGHGWCSDFETKVELLPDDTIKLTECGAGEELIYRPAAGVASPQTAKRYLAHGQDYNNIVLVDGQFVRSTSCRVTEVFDRDGQRIRLKDANGNSIRYDYEQGRVVKASRNDGQVLSFSYGSEGKVAAVSASNKKTTRYRYAGTDLIAATGEDRKVTTYHYDDKHRLERATWPDKRTVKLKYDTSRDWLVSLTDRDGCVETYEYPGDTADPQHHFWSNVSKACKDKESVTAKAEYWYQPQTDGGNYLARIRSEWNGSVRDVRYHEQFHLPVSISYNNAETSYDYYPNGLVKARNVHLGVTSYRYEEDKVKRIEMLARDNDGKELFNAWSEFGYDTRGNMITARNSEGNKVILSYNSAGQIAVLRGDRIREVSVQYDRLCAKPGVVTLKGVGSIRVSYTRDCEIKKVDSKHTPAVAMHVSSMFNNLLEVTAPANQDVYDAADSIFSSTEGRTVECQNCQISQVSPVGR